MGPARPNENREKTRAHTKSPRSTRRVGRVGRPPRRLAAQVESRLLKAATRVFLKRGLAGASIDEIAAEASAGKPTLYARFASKEELFTAVVMRSVSAAVARFESDLPLGATAQARLEGAAANILRWALSDDVVRLMRLVIAEAGRFPELGNSVRRTARQRTIEGVTRLLSELGQSQEAAAGTAFSHEHLPATAERFHELILLPLLMRALFGESPRALHAEIERHAARSVAFFLAACRSDQHP